MIFEICAGAVEPLGMEWVPGELELEKYLMYKADGESNARLFDARVFGEQILMLENQIHTRQNKRADLVGLDQYGNGVFIELKKHEAKQGVETQALQYLANYANLKGDRFLSRFKQAKPAIDEFLVEYDVNSLNQKSRIILVARSFDESVFSIGEWLASQGVAFRCIEYHPFTVENRTFLSFAVRFDRSREPLYQLAWESRAPQYFWHNVGGSPIALAVNDMEAQDAWWQHHIRECMISASFSNEPADAGDKILNSYVAGDTVLAYASGFGAIGWGNLGSPSYGLVGVNYDQFAASGRHRHRLKGVRWQNVASSVRDAITAKELKERFGLTHPIQTKSRIRRDQAEALIAEMKVRFGALA